MKRLLASVAPPMILLILVIAAWHFAVVGFGIKAFLVPKPARVLAAAIAGREELLQAVGLTAGAALGGFFSSLMVGTLIACVFSQSIVIRRSCYPYAIFLQTVPIIAIAPLIVVWFGAGFRSVVLVSFILSLFPIITNGTTGLISIDPDLLDLFRLYRASRWQILWKLRLPHSIPYLVTGARISSGLAVVGAIVGEFFAGDMSDKHGLGYVIFQTSGHLRTDMLFASVIASTLLGIAIFGLSTFVSTTILKQWSVPNSRT